MKKIIILVIALLSTGIVFSAINSKKDVSVKTVEIKVQKGDFTKPVSGMSTAAIGSAD
jgi:hypothetical protein